MRKWAALSVLAVILPSTLMAEAESGTKVLSAVGGRYVFGQTSIARSDQFLLDTKTGRLWVIAPSENNLPFRLSPVMLETSNNQFTPFPEESFATKKAPK